MKTRLSWTPRLPGEKYTLSLISGMNIISAGCYALLSQQTLLMKHQCDLLKKEIFQEYSNMTARFLAQSVTRFLNGCGKVRLNSRMRVKKTVRSSDIVSAGTGTIIRISVPLYHGKSPSQNNWFPPFSQNVPANLRSLMLPIVPGHGSPGSKRMVSPSSDHSCECSSVTTNGPADRNISLLYWGRSLGSTGSTPRPPSGENVTSASFKKYA